ncbi:isopenicillin N synthase family dioxygenase [Streptomyces zhihengii]
MSHIPTRRTTPRPVSAPPTGPSPDGGHDERMAELTRESRMGGLGTENRERVIRRIDMRDFDERRAEITDALWSAATESGFFQITGHGIGGDEVDAAFAAAEKFFALPEEAKGRHPLKKGLNAGWESMTQVRPSTGTADQKESYQLTRPHMAGLWPEGELPGFRETLLEFESRCRDVALRVLSCFAERLGMEREFFDHAHDPASPGYQSTLRLLHYFPVPSGAESEGVWRAGAHTDFDCLTLLFQREGQGGLQVCPGKDADGQEWTPVVPAADVITCNIGDMLMRWSDDRLPSTFHRVTGPGPDEDHGDRYSIAFFAQADRDVEIVSPGGTYPPITAAAYLRERISANFAR